MRSGETRLDTRRGAWPPVCIGTHVSVTQLFLCARVCVHVFVYVFVCACVHVGVRVDVHTVPVGVVVVAWDCG